ncbi:TnsA endonuclease N-terminal domain-containing protein [Pseudoalteromonas pernae]|uniref:TnsA endonuclease N-terminal domain-containing protein n=1 Tax=Pseudoalteromonas pernae TaxID=3118054 RepID=UPI003242B5BF
MMKNSDLIVPPKVVQKLNKWKKDISFQYEPYLTVRDVNKIGRRHWIFCSRQQREVHLLSDGERRAYDILLAMKGMISVMEQYALDLDDTLEIADSLGFIHPRNYKTREVVVMTTDFVVDRVINGVKQRQAYTFKYANQLFEDANKEEQKPAAWRTWQKFEIERLYWESREVEYRIITEKHATKELSWNIQFCEPCRGLTVPDELLSAFIEAIYATWLAAPTQQLQVLCASVAQTIDVEPKVAMKLFKFAVYHGYLPIAHDAHLRIFRPVTLLAIS